MYVETIASDVNVIFLWHSNSNSNNNSIVIIMVTDMVIYDQFDLLFGSWV